MNNEEKSYEILKSIVDNNQSLEYYQQQGPYAAAMEMAQWKDEQFFKFLLWFDDFYVIRKFDDGEPMTYGELIDAFKNMDK